VVLQLDAEWNNVVYNGEALPVEQALNDALNDALSVWRWRSVTATWTRGAPDLLNSLGVLDPGAVVWLRAGAAGPWTQIGAAQQGADGPAGLACWDLNGDGVFDPAVEDRNGDGVADALDCRGEPGLPGRACWDSNANGLPDPNEDITGDGTANALDCQGEDADIASVFLTTALVDVVRITAISTGTNNFISAIAVCPPNTVLVGGGGVTASPALSVDHIFSSHPSTNGAHSWAAGAKTKAGETIQVEAHALCASRGFVLGGVP